MFFGYTLQRPAAAVSKPHTAPSAASLNSKKALSNKSLKGTPTRVSVDSSRPSRLALRRNQSVPVLAMPAPVLERAVSDSDVRNPLLPSPADQADITMMPVLFLEYRITNLEERLKIAMGPWAMNGLRYCTIVGLSSAISMKVALSLVVVTSSLVPVIGVAIFLGIFVGGILAGVVAQTIARQQFARSGQSNGFLQEIEDLQQLLLAKERRSPVETKALRRLQILKADIDGGIVHSLWSIMHGILGIDPELSRMMKQADHEQNGPVLPANA